MVQGLTLAASLAFSVLALVVRPGQAIGVLIGAMLLFPEYLRIQVGGVDLSCARFVCLVLLVRLVMGSHRRMFKWKLIDTIVLLAIPWDVLANMAAGANSVTVISVGGRVLDTTIFYFVARLALPRLEDLRDAVVPMALTALAMGFVGIMEAVTVWSPYEQFLLFRKNVWFQKELQFRLGLLRARSSLSHPIYFGMAMFLVTGLLWATRGMWRQKWAWAICLAAGVAATFSSMSSGPWLSLAVFAIVSSFYFMPRLIKPALAVLLVFAVLVELGSNRHIYELLDYVALSGGTAWYRSRLIEVAFKMLPEYWLFGYGGVNFSHWARHIDGRNHVDVVNNFILSATRAGLLSLVMYVTVCVLALRDNVRRYRLGGDVNRQVGFGLAALILAVSAGQMSVGLFSAPLMLTYLVLGASVLGTTDVVRDAGARRTSGAVSGPMNGATGTAWQGAFGAVARPGSRPWNSGSRERR